MEWNAFQKIAHRGFSSRYPENTLEAFEQAILVGATMIETDIQWVEGDFIIAHDPVWVRSSSDLLLVDVLSQLQKRILYYLEVKTDALQVEKFPRVVQELEQIMDSFGIKDRCLLVSFDVSFLTVARQLGWKNLGVNHECAVKPFDAFNCIEQSLVNGAVTEPTFVWTVNDESRMRELIEWGVRGIVTDDVALLSRVVSEMDRSR